MAFELQCLRNCTLSSCIVKRFDKVIAKIKWCSFFALQCRWLPSCWRSVEDGGRRTTEPRRVTGVSAEYPRSRADSWRIAGCHQRRDATVLVLVQQIYDILGVGWEWETQRSQNRPLRDAAINWEGWWLLTGEMERVGAVTQVGLEPTECCTGNGDWEDDDPVFHTCFLLYVLQLYTSFHLASLLFSWYLLWSLCV